MEFTSNICRAFGEVLSNVPFDNIFKTFYLVGTELLQFMNSIHKAVDSYNERKFTSSFFKLMKPLLELGQYNKV